MVYFFYEFTTLRTFASEYFHVNICTFEPSAYAYLVQEACASFELAPHGSDQDMLILIYEFTERN